MRGCAGLLAVVVLAPLSARAQAVIDAAAHGVVCDGVSDNARAVGAINTLLAKGGTLRFPPAALPCLTSLPLRPGAGSRVSATPGTVTIAAAATISGPILFIDTVGGAGGEAGAPVVISGITFDGGGARFMGSISGSRLTVTAWISGVGLRVGDPISHTGIGGYSAVAAGTTVSAILSGDGKQGSYTVSVAQSVPLEAMYGFSTASAAAVQCYHASGMIFDDDTFQNIRGIGAVFNGCPKSGVRNSRFSNIGNYYLATGAASDRHQGVNMVVAAPVSGDFVEFNHFNDIGLDAIALASVSDSSVRGNVCALDNNELNLITTTAYAACVYLADTDHVTVTGNKSDHASGNAFDIFRSSHYVVTGNLAAYSGGAGIGLFGGAGTDGGIVSGNIVKDNGQWPKTAFPGGIALSGTNSDLAIGPNVSGDDQERPTQRYGVWANPASGGNANRNLKIIPGAMTGNSVAALGGLLSAR